MHGRPTAPLELLSATAGTGIVPPDFDGSPGFGRRGVALGDYVGKRAAELPVPGDGIGKHAVHRLGHLGERPLGRQSLGPKPVRHVSGREERERHQDRRQFFVQVIGEIHVPEVFEPLVPEQEATGPLRDRGSVLEVVERIRVEGAICGQQALTPSRVSSWQQA